MHAIIVDDNDAFREALADEPRSAVPEAKRAPLSVRADHTPRQIAEDAAAQASDDDAVVFINVNLKCRGHARQDQAGVEVLKTLRLTERFGDEENLLRDAHCVLYSFQNVEQLLRKKPSSLMICSDGVTFEQLPSDFSELDLPALATKMAPADDLDEFLRGEFTLPDERHSWANWWAARQMMKLYFFEKVEDVSIEQLEGRLANLPSPSGLSPSFQIDKDEGTVSMVEVHEDVEDTQIRNALYLFDRSSAFANELSRADREELGVHREIINQNGLRIGLIDDEAQTFSRGSGVGWQSVYSCVLFDGAHRVDDLLGAQHMDVDLNSQGGSGLEALLECLDNGFDFSSYACIFLDLRLFEDSTQPGEVANTSGVQVLAKIRELEPALPVIMTTASNKLSSFFEIAETGADAYWVKQGVDEQRTPREAIANYTRLLKLTAAAMGSEYQFARSFAEKVQELKNEPSPWWTSKEWIYCNADNYKHTTADQDTVGRILADSVEMLRAYLSETKMQPKGRDQSEAFWASAIVQQLANVVEVIHNIDHGNTDPLKDSKRGENMRHDQIALYLTYIRHNASHHKSFEGFAFEDIAFYVELLMLWLNNEEYAEGVRGEFVYHNDEWHKMDKFIDGWSFDGFVGPDDYSGHQLLRLYLMVAWWLEELSYESEQTISASDRQRLGEKLKQITKRRKADCDEWEKVKTRFTDDSGNAVDVEEKLRAYL